MRQRSEQTVDSPNELEVLKLRYDQLLTERDRLRSARGNVTSRLGPLPASAAIVIALAGGVVHKVDSGYLIAAGALFLILIGFSTIYSSLRPYRIMLAEDPREGNEPERTIGATVNSRLPEKRWLEERIGQEQRLYGPLRTSQRTWPTLKPKDLQQAFDVERWVFVIVQLLFAAIILVLVAGLALD